MYNPIVVGSIIGLCIVAAWIIWATQVYRWSIDRITSIIQREYTARNVDFIAENDGYITIDNIIIDRQRQTISAHVAVKKRTTSVVIREEIVSYAIATSSDCHSRCISV